MTTAQKLAWGARDLVPENAKAAWGARLIITQTGDVDIVPDRQDLISQDSQSQADLIVDLTMSNWQGNLSRMLKSYEVSTREAKEVTVYEDDQLVVRGNSNGSHGYFYIAAWLK